MKLDFESLSAEPLFYMLMQSGAFVTVLGFIFFFIGLLFGYANWGRYKRQARELRGEAEAMKAEIADLKRKVGDQSVKSGPAIAMATETIYMPQKDVLTVPAVAGEGHFSLATPTTHVIDMRQPPVAEDKTVTPPPAVSETVSTPMFPVESPLLEDSTPPHPEQEEHSAADWSPQQDGLTVPADTQPELTDLSMTPLPAVEILPVVDPKLGLIYQTQPRETDDLTALKGIAQVLEQRLHEFGIYTYAQIAAWDEDQVKEISSRLAFKDRIQRERWVEQARELTATQRTD